MKDRDFLELCKSRNVKEVEAAMTNGIDVNAKDDNGRTALIEAAIYGRTEIAELLLQHGADVNAKDTKNRTALLWAVGNHNPQTAEVLLKYGIK